MEENRRNRTQPNNPVRNALQITGGVFLVLYLILGILFLSVKKLPFEMDPSVKTAFGIILIVYASVRLWRVITNYRQRNTDE